MTNYIHTTDVFKRDLYIMTAHIECFTVEELNTDNPLKFNFEFRLKSGKINTLYVETENDVTYILDQILGEE